MALIWSENIDGNRYEIRSAGASLRLYRNGVHHTQYNESRPLSGAIWDLLAATAFFRQPDTIQQALILGFGAGAAGRLLREVVSPHRVVGIDMDPIHLSIANGFFDCGAGCELVAADAIEWVNAHCKKERRVFDWILEDIYAEDGNVPTRCAPSTEAWFFKLAGMLKPNGMLVVNIVEPSEVKKLPLFTSAKLRKRFPYAVQFSLPAYDNRVLAFSRESFCGREFKKNVLTFYDRFPKCRDVVKKYRIIRKRNA
jgi:spermidine synthase